MTAEVNPHFFVVVAGLFVFPACIQRAALSLPIVVVSSKSKFKSWLQTDAACLCATEHKMISRSVIITIYKSDGWAAIKSTQNY